MTKVFNKFKKPYFRGKSIFSKNPVLWRTSYGPITPCNVLDKTYEPISRKLPERTERRNPYHRTFLDTAEGPKIGCVRRCLSLSHLLKYFLVNTPITQIPSFTRDISGTMAAWLFIISSVVLSITSLKISMTVPFRELLHENGPIANEPRLKINFRVVTYVELSN